MQLSQLHYVIIYFFAWAFSYKLLQEYHVKKFQLSCWWLEIEQQSFSIPRPNFLYPWSNSGFGWVIHGFNNFLQWRCNEVIILQKICSWCPRLICLVILLFVVEISICLDIVFGEMQNQSWSANWLLLWWFYEGVFSATS